MGPGANVINNASTCQHDLRAGAAALSQLRTYTPYSLPPYSIAINNAINDLNSGADQLPEFSEQEVNVANNIHGNGKAQCVLISSSQPCCTHAPTCDSALCYA